MIDDKVKDSKEHIKVYVDKLVDYYSFENLSILFPDKCVCYQSRKPCHDIEELNCFLCYCPNYLNDIKGGGCKIHSSKGKWFYHKELPIGQIWDCSDCIIPHTKESAKEYLLKQFAVLE